MGGRGRRHSRARPPKLLQVIPTDFHRHIEVFKKSNSDKLPQHNRHDHAVPVEGNAQPPFGPRYSAVELTALDAYLKQNLSKGSIRPWTSPGCAPIPFVKKADGSLRLCVDYRGLNACRLLLPKPQSQTSAMVGFGNTFRHSNYLSVGGQNGKTRRDVKTTRLSNGE